MDNKKEIIVDGVIYVPKTDELEKAQTREGMEYVLVRTYSAGVHCGFLKKEEGKEVVLLDSIRLWQWSGAAACSQLAMEGVSNPEDCKFEMPATENRIKEAIEILPMTEKAKESITGVASWKA